MPEKIPHRSARLSREQVKHLRERLSKARHLGVTQAIARADLTKPAQVVKAQKLIASWERKRAAAASKARLRFMDQVTKAEQTILFGEPADAIAAVESVERMSAGRRYA